MEAVNITDQDFFPESPLLNVYQHTTARTSPLEFGGIFQNLGSHISRNPLITPADPSCYRRPRVQGYILESSLISLISGFPGEHFILPHEPAKARL